MTHFWTAILILVILGIGVGKSLIPNKPTIPPKPATEIVQPSPSPTTKPLTPEEETAKLCGPIDEELLGIKESPDINIEHLLWAPGCDNFAWSISWNLPDKDPKSKNLQPKGVYVHSIPDKKTTKIPLPKNYPSGYFLGWNSDHEMLVTYKFGDTDPYNVRIYDIQTGQYQK